MLCPYNGILFRGIIRRLFLRWKQENCYQMYKEGGVKDTWSFHKNLSGSVSASVKPGTQNRRSKYLPFRIPELFYLLVSLKICPSPSPLAFHTLNNDIAEFSTLLFLTFKRATCFILDLSWVPLHYAYPFGASLSPTFCSLTFQGSLFFSHLSLLCSQFYISVHYFN